MAFYFLRINSGKLLGLILAGSISVALAVYGLAILDKYSNFLSAGVATILFFGGGWLLNSALNAIQEPVCITVLPAELTEINQQTGARRSWPYAEIIAYRFLPPFRGVHTLLLTLRSGCKAKVIGNDISLLSDKNAVQFELMVHAFKAAWHQVEQVQE